MKILRTVPFLFVLFASLLVVQLPTHANSLPLTVSVGYADNAHCPQFTQQNPGICTTLANPNFPNPWKGSPGIAHFLGVGVGGVGFDAGALLLTNNSGADVNVSAVTVTIGAQSFSLDLWQNFTVPIGQSDILTMTSFDPILGPNFDSSDTGQGNVTPSIAITIGGNTTVLSDADKILNTGGFDLGCTESTCTLTNESHPWVVVTPEPSSMLLLGSGLLWLGVGFRRKFHR
jgi:hypothetical protein